MFVNWKIIATTVIVLLVLVVFLANNPVVSRFFAALGQRVQLPVGGEPQRPVAFSLALDSYEPLDVTDRLLNVSVTGQTTASLQEGRLQVNRTLNVINFRGTGSVDYNTLTLNGSFEKVEWPDVSIFLNGPIRLDSAYKTVVLDNFALKTLSLDTTGVLTVGATQTRFNGTISVSEARGTFSFNATSGTLSISGSAARIAIPSAGINVG